MDQAVNLILVNFIAMFIDSISDSMYWTIVTMTTCGYGDKTPFTFLGRTFGTLVAFSGSLIVALPTAILGHHFFHLSNSKNEKKHF